MDKNGLILALHLQLYFEHYGTFVLLIDNETHRSVNIVYIGLFHKPSSTRLQGLPILTGLK